MRVESDFIPDEVEKQLSTMMRMIQEQQMQIA